MITTVIFDADGVVVRRDMYFSQRFSQEFGVPIEKVLPFFKNEFPPCLVGRADLKQELKKYLAQWNWQKSVDDLLHYWFQHESDLDGEILESIKILRRKGIHCYLGTDNEKYRLHYLLENLGLKDFFDGVFPSVELGYCKAQQEFWSAAHERLGRPNKSSVLVWDDNKEDVESVKRFGFLAERYSSFDVYEYRMKSLMIG